MSYFMRLVKSLQKRARNPFFLPAVASLAYKVLTAKGLLKVDFGTYKEYVDLAAWLLMGAGVYASYEPKQVPENENP